MENLPCARSNVGSYIHKSNKSYFQYSGENKINILALDNEVLDFVKEILIKQLFLLYDWGS